MASKSIAGVLFLLLGVAYGHKYDSTRIIIHYSNKTTLLRLSQPPLQELEGNVLFEPAAPMFHLLIFGNVLLKTVVLLIGEISYPLETVLLLIGEFSLSLETVLFLIG